MPVEASLPDERPTPLAARTRNSSLSRRAILTMIVAAVLIVVLAAFSPIALFVIDVIWIKYFNPPV